jgi:hypothetical protein
MEKVRPGTDREDGLGHGLGSAEQDAKAEGTNSRRLRRRRNNCRGCPERPYRHPCGRIASDISVSRGLSATLQAKKSAAW